MKRLLVIVAVVAVLLALAVAVPWSLGAFGEGEVAPTTVRAQDVDRGELVEFVTAPGVVEAQSQVDISARLSAQITALPHDEGQTVTRGDPDVSPPVPPSVLVKLDDTDLQARLRAAKARRAGQQAALRVAETQIRASEAQRKATQVQLDDAQRELARQQSLFGSNDVSRRAVDDAQAAYDQLNAQMLAADSNIAADELNLEVLGAQIEAADAEIEQATDQLQYTTIVSPIDGTITSLRAEVGEIVVTGTMNNAGTVIMTVADLSRMIVEAQVDETDVTQVKVGQRAIVRCSAYGERELGGTVRSVALSKVDERGDSGGGGGQDSRYYICEVLLDPEDTGEVRVFSGLTADVRILTEEHQDVVRVPSQAVVGRRVGELPAELRDLPEIRKEKEFTTVVFRVVDGVARATPVTVGPSDLQMTLIESGLEAGAKIVTGPYKVLENLKDGEAVNLETPGGPAATDEADEAEDEGGRLFGGRRRR